LNKHTFFGNFDNSDEHAFISKHFPRK